MPLYDFRCSTCNTVFEEYAKMDEKTALCVCGGHANRLISGRHYLHTDYASKDFVTADITGSDVRITSRKQMRQLCAEHGVYAKEGRPKNETKHRREEMRDRERRLQR